MNEGYIDLYKKTPTDRISNKARVIRSLTSLTKTYIKKHDNIFYFRFNITLNDNISLPKNVSSIGPILSTFTRALTNLYRTSRYDPSFFRIKDPDLNKYYFLFFLKGDVVNDVSLIFHIVNVVWDLIVGKEYQKNIELCSDLCGVINRYDFNSSLEHEHFLNTLNELVDKYTIVTQGKNHTFSMSKLTKEEWRHAKQPLTIIS